MPNTLVICLCLTFLIIFYILKNIILSCCHQYTNIFFMTRLMKKEKQFAILISNKDEYSTRPTKLSSKVAIFV